MTKLNNVGLGLVMILSTAPAGTAQKHPSYSP